MSPDIGSPSKYNCVDGWEMPPFFENYGNEKGAIHCRTIRVKFGKCGTEKKFLIPCEKDGDEHKITCDGFVKEVNDKVFEFRDLFCMTCKFCNDGGRSLKHMGWPIEYGKEPSVITRETSRPKRARSGHAKLLPRPEGLISGPKELNSEPKEKGESAKRSKSLTPMDTRW